MDTTTTTTTVIAHVTIVNHLGWAEGDEGEIYEMAGDEVVLSAHGNLASVVTAVGAVVRPRALEWSAPVAGRMVARIDETTRMEIWVGLDLDLIDEAVVPTIEEMDAPALSVAAALAA